MTQEKKETAASISKETFKKKKTMDSTLQNSDSTFHAMIQTLLKSTSAVINLWSAPSSRSSTCSVPKSSAIND